MLVASYTMPWPPEMLFCKAKGTSVQPPLWQTLLSSFMKATPQGREIWDRMELARTIWSSLVDSYLFSSVETCFLISETASELAASSGT